MTVKPTLRYFQEVKSELSRVSWPKREEVVKLTLLTIIISTIVATYAGLLDFAFTKLLEVVVSR